MNFLDTTGRPQARFLEIHILLGKRRLRQQSGYQGEPQYESVWGLILGSERALQCDVFNEALMYQVKHLAQQASQEEPLTFFFPLGRYMSFTAKPFLFPDDVPEGIYIPPATSIMTNLSTRSDVSRPIWVEFEMHSTSSNPNDFTFHDEVNLQLRRLDSLLGSGPDGHNALHLTEVPASTPNLAIVLALNKRDCACMAELCDLVVTLNGPSDPVQRIVTRFGAVSCDDSDDEPVLRENYADFLSWLSGNMFFAWLRVDDMESVAGNSPRPVSRPGFRLLMERYASELILERIRRTRP